MGTASGAFHQFAEATSKRWFTDAWQDKLAAGFTNSGSKSGDKGHTLQFFQTLAAQHGMHWVNLGLQARLELLRRLRVRPQPARLLRRARAPRPTPTRAPRPSTRPT